jgi:hypothetical protein
LPRKIEGDGVNHVWYSRNVAGNPRAFSGFSASVWHAAPEDGTAWAYLLRFDRDL